MIVNLISNSVNAAGSSMVGQNIGAEKYRRVSRIMLSTFSIALAGILVPVILLIIMPEKIFGLFTTDASVMPIAMEYLPIGIACCFSSAFRAPMNTLFNGGENYKMNFAVALLDGMINRIGFSLLFGIALGMQYRGFWLGDTVASFTPFVIGIFYYFSGKWKTRKYVITD